ncbi:hypothetical protein BS78_02G358400 [Paspalum vaginatum]|nr:hypothetical protein BS78_02G358400 [Paspalum vaginatum]
MSRARVARPPAGALREPRGLPPTLVGGGRTTSRWLRRAAGVRPPRHEGSVVSSAVPVCPAPPCSPLGLPPSAALPQAPACFCPTPRPFSHHGSTHMGAAHAHPATTGMPSVHRSDGKQKTQASARPRHGWHGPRHPFEESGWTRSVSGNAQSADQHSCALESWGRRRPDQSHSLTSLLPASSSP